ncbi:class I SAM-dependent methyltransferase [Paenibacillus rigui]|uniref:class I SAM-dependent methyltransferase n=1 Tax=Paenibacillus rigui TaxID=554312 RepID=UPI001FEB4CB2|nr:class I SAM-dependent methyltransferase [Paenibacillus rigui]
MQNGRNELQYWNDIYKASRRGEPEGNDNWLDKHSKLLERSKDKAILDLGCGSGWDTMYLTDRGYKVIACDLSEEALHNVAEAVPAVQTRQLNLLEPLPFPTDSASVIVADLSLHYFTWSQTLSILAELQRVLEPGGALLCRVNSTKDTAYGAGQGRVIEPNLYECDGRLKRFFDRDQLHRLLAGWSILWMQETVMHRYDKPKHCWELAAAVG